MEITCLFDFLSASGTICSDSNLKGIFGIAGWIINIIKIAVPIILIVVGMIDMTKAIFAKDDSAIQSATSALVKKAIAAVSVFLVISIVMFLFAKVVGFTGWENGNCAKCLNNPSECKIDH